MSCFLSISKKLLKYKKNFFLVVMLIFSHSYIFGDELGEFYLDPDLDIIGISNDFCLRLEPGFLIDADTILRLSVGSSIWVLGYYRDTDDQYISEKDLDYSYTRLNTQWGFGIEQGLIWNPDNNKNYLSLHLRYRGVKEWNFNSFGQDSILFDSVRPDKDGILFNTLIAALTLNNRQHNKETGMIKGFYMEFAFEYGPEWFLNTVEGKTDFKKVFGRINYFYPVYEANEESWSVFKAVYFANSFGIDYIYGNDIPLPVRQSFGVMDPDVGCGGMVRGFEKRRFDSEVKVINNLEFRFIMSQIKTKSGYKLFRPGFLVYLDYCLFDKLDGYKENGSGVLLSTGFGVFSEVLFSSNIFLYVGFPLMGKRVDENPLSITAQYGFHF